MGTSGPQECLRSPPSRRQSAPTTIVMKFTDYSNIANFPVGTLGFAIHRAAGLATQERADTFIKVRKRQNLVVLSTYWASAVQKLLSLTEITLLGIVHTVTCYKALDPANTRGVLHGVPLGFSREQIRASLVIPGHRILDFRRMGDSHSIIITIEGTRLPREAIFCSAISRLYPPHIHCRPCLHCLSLHHRTDVCPTRTEFVRCRDCGTKFPPYQDPTDTPHDCQLRCFNCQGDHCATDHSCHAWKAATRALRNRARTIRNRYRYGLARTPICGDASALPGESPSDHHTPSGGSRTSSRVPQGTPNGSHGEDLLREQSCNQSQHRRDQSRCDRSQVTADPSDLRLQSPHSPRGASTASRQVADAVASHAASVGGDGRFVGAFMDGCATLDGMFTRLFHVYALLSEEENFADPELPGVAHGAIPRRSAHSVLEAPQDDSGSRLVLPTPRVSDVVRVLNGSRELRQFIAGSISQLRQFLRLRLPFSQETER
ncbi:hypothetical protein HPB48_002446 [Haemaphysalis longicornis]|uniref:Uncharacterized protein n=1 Tax=Haemaphysalis longicornis TaxID=44386 RepID=A0A9J6FAX2_HAELO|nr:hypothetical protein HPB48_002446 [Haemaphysalis longicornis]